MFLNCDAKVRLFFESASVGAIFFEKKVFAQAAGLFISFSRKKETKQRKFAGYVPEAKISTFFLKKKNSLLLKQLFLFNGKTH